MNKGIIILDFGSQYNQLIGRRIREMEVYSEILPFNTSLEEIQSKNPAGIILSGGPSSVNSPDAHLVEKELTYNIEEVLLFKRMVRQTHQ